MSRRKISSKSFRTYGSHSHKLFLSVLGTCTLCKSHQLIVELSWTKRGSTLSHIRDHQHQFPSHQSLRTCQQVAYSSSTGLYQLTQALNRGGAGHRQTIDQGAKATQLLAKSKRAEGTSPNIIGDGAETTQFFFVKLKNKWAGSLDSFPKRARTNR